MPAIRRPRSIARKTCGRCSAPRVALAGTGACNSSRRCGPSWSASGPSPKSRSRPARSGPTRTWLPRSSAAMPWRRRCWRRPRSSRPARRRSSALRAAVVFDQSEFLYGQKADLKTYTTLRDRAFAEFPAGGRPVCQGLAVAAAGAAVGAGLHALVPIGLGGQRPGLSHAAGQARCRSDRARGGGHSAAGREALPIGTCRCSAKWSPRRWARCRRS